MVRDTFGIEILPTDRVRVTAYGYGARQSDCGLARPVRAINKTRVVILDSDGRERAISGACLGVICRHGLTQGYQAHC